MTTEALRPVKTETVSCILCLTEPGRTIGEIYMDDQLLGSVAQCETCGLRFMSPRPTQMQRNWLYEKEYDSRLPGEHGGNRFKAVLNDQDQGRNRFARYLDCLGGARTPPSGGRPRLLDIGAGTGQLMELAQQRGWDIYAVEQSRDACQHLRRRFGPEAVVGNVLADVRESASGYDAIVMAHVIEHMPDPLTALMEARRLTAPGGRLLVATPNEMSLYEQLWQARERWRGGGTANRYVDITWRDGKWRRTPGMHDERGMAEFQILTTEHLFFFTRATLGYVLNEAGFGRVRWNRGAVAPANTRVGRLLKSGPANGMLFWLGLEAELVATAEPRKA